MKLKILFIPADSIEAKISRSYFLAKGLSNYCDMYYFIWTDFRSKMWRGEKKSILHTIKCFFQSIVRKHRNYLSEEYGFNVAEAPMFIDAVIGRLIGRIRAKKIMRKFNGFMIGKIVKRINPCIIFYADGFYYFPAVKNKELLIVSDLQDDTDREQLPDKLVEYEASYYDVQYKKVNKSYIVSNGARNSLTRMLRREVNCKMLNNGADFELLRKDYSSEIEQLKRRYQLQGKFIISYIGGDAWFDEGFSKKLFRKCLEDLKDVVFILVGSLPKVELPNVINFGVVSSKEAAILYQLSNMGIMLKDSDGSSFLYNSMPLKVVQYSACQKPVLTFPIKWLEQAKFSNVFLLRNNDVQVWANKINEIKESFRWGHDLDKRWTKYDWRHIAEKLYAELEIAKQKINGDCQ